MTDKRNTFVLSLGGSLVVPKGGMKSGNEELVQYAAQNVKLTGTVLKKNGQSMFLYSKIEAVQ